MELLSRLAHLLPKGACLRATSASPSNLTWPPGNTTGSSNTTDTPRWQADGGAAAAGGGEGEEPPENPQFSAFVQLWAGLQPILCGNNR